MAAMAAWLSHRGTDPGPLFHPVTQIGQVIPRRMSSQVCRWVLRKRGPADHLSEPSRILDRGGVCLGTGLLDQGCQRRRSTRVADGNLVAGPRQITWPSFLRSSPIR
jgi:hypothetical protein